MSKEEVMNTDASKRAVVTRAHGVGLAMVKAPLEGRVDR